MNLSLHQLLHLLLHYLKCLLSPRCITATRRSINTQLRKQIHSNEPQFKCHNTSKSLKIANLDNISSGIQPKSWSLRETLTASSFPDLLRGRSWSGNKKTCFSFIFLSNIAQFALSPLCLLFNPY